MPCVFEDGSSRSNFSLQSSTWFLRNGNIVAENSHSLNVMLLSHIQPQPFGILLGADAAGASCYPHNHTMQSPTNRPVPSACFLVCKFLKNVLVCKLLVEIMLLYGHLAYYFPAAPECYLAIRQTILE